jgi:hypothetical protein
VATAQCRTCTASRAFVSLTAIEIMAQEGSEARAVCERCQR